MTPHRASSCSGDGLGQLVGILRGDYLREQRPPPGRLAAIPRSPFEAGGGPAPCDAPPVRFMHLSRQD
jgi:hypothetical protein